MSGQQVGLLSALPVAVMGAVSLGGFAVRRFFTRYGGALVGLALILVALAARALPLTGTELLLTAVLCGGGVAFEQLMLPGIVRDHYAPHHGPIMGYYSSAIMGGAAFSAAATAPLAGLIGWRLALACWGLLAALALVAWCVCKPLLVGNEAASLKEPGLKEEVLKEPPVNGVLSKELKAEEEAFLTPYAWLLMVTFGIGSSAYTLILAWLPAYYTHLGWSATGSGFLLSAVTVTQVVAGTGASALLNRFPDRRPLFYGAISVLALGLVNLLFAPWLYGSAAILLGLGVGLLFSLTLVVSADYSRNPVQLVGLFGFVQGGGYLLASLTPYGGGLFQDVWHSQSAIWLLMLALCPVLFLCATRLRRAAV